MIILNKEIRKQVEKAIKDGYKNVIHWKEGKISIEPLEFLVEEKFQIFEIFKHYHEYGSWDIAYLSKSIMYEAMLKLK